MTSTVSVAAKGVRAVAVLPGSSTPSLGPARSKLPSAALHGCEASEVAQGASLRFRSACASAVWYRKMFLAHSGAVLSLLDGPVGCDPGIGVVWNRFRVMRRFLAPRSGGVPRVMRLIGSVSGGAPGHRPVHLLLKSAARLGFKLERGFLGGGIGLA